MFHKATLTYKGLTIVMSNPSRFDTRELLSGNSGAWFCNDCLRPGINRYQCDIYDVDTFIRNGNKFREGTKVVLLLGQRAQQEIGRVDTSLGEQRGSPINRDGMVYITSYLPQDSFDFKDYESYLNPHLQQESEEGNEETMQESNESEGDELGEKSRHGKTNRRNWRYWLYRDTKKAIRILNNGLTVYQEPEVIIYPSCEDIVNELYAHKDTTLYLDLETDSELNITCFGFSLGDSNNPIFVCPLIRYNYTQAYSNNGKIMLALARAMFHNTTVAHNGAGFDFFVIPYKYHSPFGHKLYDTMIAHHRCFPEVEKSLGHAISNFTDLPYHKDEGIFEPTNETQEHKLWSYNAKDVSSMREVKKGIDAYASTIKGLPESINQANQSIRAYLTTTLQGIRYREDKLNAIVNLNDRKLTQILRMVDACVGKERVKEIRGKGTSGIPSSSTQCCRYFHDLCGYPVIGRSKKTGKPSLDEKNFLKLALKGINNPVIDLVLLYRGLAKETGSLKFTPWTPIK